MYKLIELLELSYNPNINHHQLNKLHTIFFSPLFYCVFFFLSTCYGNTQKRRRNKANKEKLAKLTNFTKHLDVSDGIDVKVVDDYDVFLALG